MESEKQSSKELQKDRSGRPLGEENKKLMALGRERSRIVDAYIKALQNHKYRGRGITPLDPEKLKDRIAELDERIKKASGMDRVVLIQERLNCQNQLSSLDKEKEFQELEARFLSVIRQVSIDRKISYQAWREAGVTVRTLAKAGMYPPKKRRSASEQSSLDGLDSD